MNSRSRLELGDGAREWELEVAVHGLSRVFLQLAPEPPIADFLGDFRSIATGGKSPP